MENENPQEETPRKKVTKKVVTKSNKQESVLKQLNNQSLYPLGERIGIYVIAVLSTIGLALITYTGVMAVISSTTIGTDVAVDVDVDVDDLQDMLDEFEDLEDITETEAFQEPVETEVTEPEETEVEPEVPTEEPNDEETELVTDVILHEPFTGTINADTVSVWRSPASDALFNLHMGDEVTVLELHYNAYWARVEVENDPFDQVPRFVRSTFIDVE